VFKADCPIDSITRGEGIRLKGATTSEYTGYSVAIVTHITAAAD
jgi:hypothetical protein